MILDEVTVVVEPIEDGWWLAQVVEFPGAIAQERSKDEAIESVGRALQAYLASFEETPRKLAPGAELVKIPLAKIA